MRIVAAILALAAAPAIAQVATLSGTDGQNALGTVPCATAGLALQSCHAELRRKDDGSATLAVLLPTGETRRIYFKDGKPTSTDSASRVSSETRGDMLLVYVDPNEVFEVPADAVKP